MLLLISLSIARFGSSRILGSISTEPVRRAQDGDQNRQVCPALFYQRYSGESAKKRMRDEQIARSPQASDTASPPSRNRNRTSTGGTDPRDQSRLVFHVPRRYQRNMTMASNTMETSIPTHTPSIPRDSGSAKA